MLVPKISKCERKEDKGKKTRINENAGSSARRLNSLLIRCLSYHGYVVLSHWQTWAASHHCSHRQSVREQVLWNRRRSWQGACGVAPGTPRESAPWCRRVFRTSKWTLDRVSFGEPSQDSTQTSSGVLKGILILCCLNSSSYLWVISWKGNCILIWGQ